jgi:hypothetical protein
MKNATTETNIVRLSKGADWVRFEVVSTSPWGTLHNSLGEARDLKLGDIRERIARLIGAGWTPKTVL